MADSSRLAQRAFVLLSAAWSAALPAAAIASAPASPGRWAYLFSLAAYGVGSVVCHQLPERSFFLFGRQLPVCARCTGIYLGGTVCALAAAAAHARPVDARAARAVVVLACVPTALTLLFEWTTGAAPSNAVRAAAGAALGAPIAWILVGVLAPRGRGVAREARRQVN